MAQMRQMALVGDLSKCIAFGRSMQSDCGLAWRETVQKKGACMDPERTSDNFNSIFYINPVLITYSGAYSGENSDVFSLFTARGHARRPVPH